MLTCVLDLCVPFPLCACFLFTRPLFVHTTFAHTFVCSLLTHLCLGKIGVVNSDGTFTFLFADGDVLENRVVGMLKMLDMSDAILALKAGDGVRVCIGMVGECLFGDTGEYYGVSASRRVQADEREGGAMRLDQVCQ